MYINFNLKVQAVEGHDYVREDNLRDALQDLENIEFAYQIGRNQGLAILGNLVKERYLFNYNTRFPSNHWVDISDGDWPTLFSQMRSALGFKVPSSGDKSLSTTASSYKGKDGKDFDIPMQVYNDFKDSSLAFSNAIKSMQEQIGRTVTFRVKFEQKYNLIWETPKVHHEHHDKSKE